jgi:hypothetical protein
MSPWSISFLGNSVPKSGRQGQLVRTAKGRLSERVVELSRTNRWSALNRLLDHSVAEFFVLRKYRRIGVGSRAASLIRPLARALGGSCGRVQQAGSNFLEKGN